MERMELRREATRLLSDFQYLKHKREVVNDNGLRYNSLYWYYGDILRDLGLLCDFEDPQQADTPEYRETQGSHSTCRQHDHLQDTT